MKKELWRWLGISFALHILASIFSSGFYHADEHFQILEFLNYRLGKSPASDLSIEFQRAMRPWLQPALYAGIGQSLKWLGFTNPHTWALSFRIFSSLIGWLSLVGLALCSLRWFSDQDKSIHPFWRRFSLIASALIWYLPAFHARHSSENLAGATFFLGLSSLLLFSSARISLAAGMLFGAAFEFRYQVGFMVAGAFFWFLFVARLPLRRMALILVGIFLSVGLGTLADRWGYGRWTLAPWNYVQFNLIEGHVADVDTSPWWDFFRRAFTETWPPLGLVLLLSFPVAWIRWPKHPLTWATVPLYLIHTIIGHKELRFLFPIIHAGPVLLTMAIASRHSFRQWPWPARKLSQLLFGINFVALAVLTVFPAWMPIRFYEQLSRRSGPIQLYYIDNNPFRIAGIPLNFYRPDPSRVTIQPLTTFGEALERLRSQHELWLFHTRSRLPAEASSLAPYCKAEFSSLPGWVESLNYRGILDRMTNWSLFRCTF